MVALTGDLMQTFLQVRIREEDRDVMRFYWYKDIKIRADNTAFQKRSVWRGSFPVSFCRINQAILRQQQTEQPQHFKRD